MSSHDHHGRICHLNGCDDETIPVECPACGQVIGSAPKGGMAQSSATWDKRVHHLPDCPAEWTRGVEAMTPVDLPPPGWDPDTYRAPPCPVCGMPVQIDWVERTPLGRPPSWLPGRLECPTSRYHDVQAASRVLARVSIEHPDVADRHTCPLSELDDWRQRGWYPVDEEHQTSTEMVEAKVRQMRREEWRP